MAISNDWSHEEYTQDPRHVFKNVKYDTLATNLGLHLLPFLIQTLKTST